MDRQTVYSAAIPRSFDILQQEQNSMIALAKLAEFIFGTSGYVDGFAATPTTPASLNVNVAAGQVMQLASLEATNWSSIGADTTHQILKQGIALDSQAIAITPPATPGFSQVFLIEVQYADQDGNATVLPYFNSGTPFPQPPLNGPGGAGTSQPTVRKGIAAVQVKAGIAAATGTQVAPSADSGWIGLWQITVANGQTTITSGNIVQVSSPVVPSITPKLPAIPAYIQAGSPMYARDTGSANAIIANFVPAITSLLEGTELRIKILANNTGATTALINGVSYPVTHGDATALVQGDLLAGQIGVFLFDGANLQIVRSTVDPTTVLQVGDPIWRPIAGTLPKFVRANGLTIGDGSSTATERANADTLPLYTFLWNNFTNTQCPVSGGRGISAAVDFSVHKTIQLLDMRFRGPIGLDDMGNSAAGRSTGATFITGNATTAGAVGGEASHILTSSESAVHTHANTLNESPHSHLETRNNGSPGPITDIAGSVSLSASGTVASAYSTQTALTGITITNVSSGSGGAHNNMSPFMTGTWYLKL
jgi:hypothetical protein